MSDTRSALFTELTTEPIFDDGVFLREALDCLDCQNEDEFDAQLAVAARESGIEDPYRFLYPDVHGVSIAFSAVSISTEPRSSMSIHSGETQSTGFTSQPSRRTSRDLSSNPYVDGQRAPPSSARASLSLENYDSVMDRFRPPMRQNHSSATFTGANSGVSSTASSMSKPSQRKHKRPSGLFSMFRRDSGNCPSRSHHGRHLKPQTPKLDCGHSLTKRDIHLHVKEALGSSENLAPNCCGTPLPRAVLERVMTAEQAAIVSIDALRSPVMNSLRDSGYSEDGVSPLDFVHSLDSLPLPTDSFVTAPDSADLNGDMAREDEESLSPALAKEAFKALQSQQKEQFGRVSLFESNQKRALSAYHQWVLRRLALQLKTDKAERPKQHLVELERLEERQIAAEHDLRKAHEQETQNMATALKYMEAYCRDSKSENLDAAHVVTEEDLKKLACQYATQEKLPAKHESAINVLRAKQERGLETKLQKQEAELQQLDADYEKNKRTEDLQYLKDLSRLDATIQARRRRLACRWDLTFEIWRRDWQDQHGTAITGPLPHEAWPEDPDIKGPITPISSLALYTHMLQ
ncbi:hypothetical protein BDV95DRAFT_611140 [Massariosphaeria phaeospora]|uniref:Uncharacterized protein n=1 Tax=Massariosphaeria phaeospora TaxID=100035 RepID=A0A7C8I3M8_9PLEO|nr:hypothetical protein BDV95DRAFT_611140 [Massariosphaeria phaeospora]